MNKNASSLFAILCFTLAPVGCGSSTPMMAAPSNDGGSPGDAGAGDVGSSTDVAADAACLAYDSGTSGAFQPGSPITGLTDQTWVRVDFPEAHCRSGSATGISVNANSASKKLVIFLEGGGACFNTLTCAANPSSATFGTPSGGILNRADMANPVRDWNFIDIPYCTGDVFAGNNPNGSVPGVGAQQFVGYTNMGAFLQRIVPTFPGLTQCCSPASAQAGSAHPRTSGRSLGHSLRCRSRCSTTPAPPCAIPF